MAKVKKMALGGMGSAIKSAANSVRNAAAAMPPQAKPGTSGPMGSTIANAPLQARPMGDQMKLAQAAASMPPPPAMGSKPGAAGLGAVMRGASAPSQLGSLRDALGKAGAVARPFKEGGTASSRADGIASKGKTRGKFL